MFKIKKILNKKFLINIMYAAYVIMGIVIMLSSLTNMILIALFGIFTIFLFILDIILDNNF